MNIALVTQEVIQGNGQGRVNYEVGQEVLRRGHTLTLLATRVAPELEAHPQAQWVQIPLGQWPTQLVRNWVFARRTARWLRRHRSQVDVLQLNGYVSYGPSEVNAAHFVHHAWLRSPFHIARMRRGPYAWYQWLYSAVNARLERDTFGQAQVVVAVSNQVRNDLCEAGIDASSIQVIVNGVDIDEFAPGPVDRNNYGLPPDVPLALFAGDIRSPRKNLDTLLHALVDAPALHLAVAGDTEGSPFPALAKQLGLTDRVTFLGYRRDIADLMRAADLFVFPSRYDPCPLVILEALASGLPVITSRRVGSSDLITPTCGVVFDDPNDVAALARTLQDLAQDPERRRQMSQVARAVGEAHSFVDMAKRYVDLFEHVHHGKAEAAAS